MATATNENWYTADKKLGIKIESTSAAHRAMFKLSSTTKGRTVKCR